MVAQLKFVVERSEDLTEIRTVLAAAGGAIPPWKVLLMPKGTDTATLRVGEAVALNACKTEGYRFRDRLHIHLFGHTKGT